MSEDDIERDIDREWLAARFEASRDRLREVAFRMLGSQVEAEDAVQEAWLRVSRADAAGVENVEGWLTTIVARLCLDALRSRKARPEESLSAHDDMDAGHDPERDVVMADSIGLALLVVLETLTPGERVAFVLHDMFDLPFDEIAPVIGKSPAAARQLASRARRRVQGGGGATAARPEGDLARRRAVVEAFLAASRGGDFESLLAMLDPSVVLRADAAAVQMGAPGEVRGAHDLAKMFAGRAQAARLALVDGAPAAVWAPGGQPRVVFAFAIEGGTIVGIEMVADAGRLERMDVEVVDG